jgi:hypothetical protein
MAEAFVIITLSLLAALAAVIFRLRTKNSPLRPEEAARLREHLAWLEERQRHADEQRWDADMKQRIQAQIDAARRQLATRDIDHGRL